MSPAAARAADVVVIGAGIAGASAAFALARAGLRVVLLERESQPAYHTTGRSAALFIKCYGNATVRRLTVDSEPFYREPSAGFAEVPLLTPRGFMFVARGDQLAKLHEEIAFARRFVPAVRRLEADEARALVPLLRPGYAAAAMLDPEARDLDVAAIMGGYLRGLRAAGGELLCNAEVTGLRREERGWRVASRAGEFATPVVVDAAGAWADTVAGLAGLSPLGLVPRRRTAFLVDPPDGVEVGRWPLVADVEEQFYIKPDAGRILCSPADETPSPPCDAAPEELDVAIAVERIQRAFDLPVRHIRHRWAGLRTFAPDDTPVLGFDPRAEGFFWLAGQGGYGIQTAPAMAALAAAVIAGTGGTADAGLLEVLDPARLLRDR